MRGLVTVARAGALAIVLGTALLMFGAMNFTPAGSMPNVSGPGQYLTGYSYNWSSRLEATAGAALIVAGLLARSRPKPPRAG